MAQETCILTVADNAVEDVSCQLEHQIFRLEGAFNEPSGKGEKDHVEMCTDGTWNDKRCNQNHLVVHQF
ncbi:pulmonary surfactant-associated protein A-like [Phaenicophaeus curvirostris]|uniref:pulmonary surfactant-associated protein A-like n=1 Tax=Phaenicophaeus curvirostris TaxID=33595 RepID=UPI0037F0E2F6